MPDDEDSATDLRAQVCRAEDAYAALVRLEEQYPERDWIGSAIERAAAAVATAKQSLREALEPPAPPEPEPPALRLPDDGTKSTCPAGGTSSPDPMTVTWAKQARFHTCAQFRSELTDALAQLQHDDAPFTRATIAAALGRCTPDTLDKYCTLCDVELGVEIARAQRSRRTSDPSENFG